MNIYKSFVADTPVDVYWLMINDHPEIVRIVSEDGRVIRVDSTGYGEMLKKIREKEIVR